MLIKRLYNLDAELLERESGIFSVRMSGAEAVKVLRDMRLATVPIRIDKSLVRGECCKRAFIRGAFLGGGAICAPQKGYHMELVTGHYALCGDFAEILRFFDVSPRFIKRKGNYVFYIKDSEQMCDLLAALGAHAQMMALLNVKIEKEVRNSTNRRVNCENANAEKTADAAVLQAHAIRLLADRVGLDHLPPQLESVARARLESPEATLAELARALGLTKSGVNHRMRRLMQLAEENKNG